MSGYPLFIPEFVLCTNSSLFWYKIANELREFRNYLFNIIPKKLKLLDFSIFSYKVQHT